MAPYGRDEAWECHAAHDYVTPRVWVMRVLCLCEKTAAKNGGILIESRGSAARQWRQTENCERWEWGDRRDAARMMIAAN
jgi:hypothetical protein